MTVAALSRVVEYLGDAVTQVFAVPFQFFASGDLEVALRDADGVETVQTLTTHYTVSGGNGATGSVTFLSAPAVGLTVIVRGDTDILQETEYVNGDTFPAESHERALDRLTMIAQERKDGIDALLARALLVPRGESGYTLLKKALRANLFPVFDINGDLAYSQGTGADAGLRQDLAADGGVALVRHAAMTIETYVDIATTTISAIVDSFYLQGYHEVGVGGARYKRSVTPAQAESADGAYWALAETAPTAKMFGAVGDGSSYPLSTWYASLAAAQIVYPHALALTDEIDGIAIQACINAGYICDLEWGIYLTTYEIVPTDGNGIVGNSPFWRFRNFAKSEAKAAIIKYAGDNSGKRSVSSTNRTIETGPGGIVVEPGKTFTAGDTIFIRRTDYPYLRFMRATVDDYDSVTGDLDFTADIAVTDSVGPFSGADSWSIVSPVAVVRCAPSPVGYVGSDVTPPFTLDMLNMTLRNVHVDADNKADYGWYIYRAGNQSTIGNLTADNAIDTGTVMLGCFSAKFGHFGAYYNGKYGFQVSRNLFGWSSEWQCYAFDGSFDAKRNIGAGGYWGPGRGSKVEIVSEMNGGLPGELSSATTGPVNFRLQYSEGNVGLWKVHYPDGARSITIEAGYFESSLSANGILIEGQDANGFASSGAGPGEDSEMLTIRKIYGRASSDNLDIDSNTSRFYVEDMDAGTTYLNSMPRREGVIGSFAFLPASTITVSFQRGGTLSRTGAGTFRFTFAKFMALTDYSPSLTLEAVTGGVTHLPVVTNRGTQWFDFKMVQTSDFTTVSDSTTLRVIGSVTRHRNL